MLFSEGNKSREWLNSFWGFQGPQGDDVVSLEVAVIEQPLGDRFLDSDIWDEVDEQVLSGEDRSRLRKNGLRVGLVGGIVPARLQSLLTSQGSNPTPRHFRLRSGNPAEVPLAGSREELTFELHPAEGEPEEVSLTSGEVSVRLIPTIDKEGVRVRCLPHARHGSPKLWRTPEEGGGLAFQGEQTDREFDGLAWEFRVKPGEYALIGTEYGQPGTFGNLTLITPGSASVSQRMIVIRASVPNRASNSPRIAEPEPTPNPTAPLASQAKFSAVSEPARAPD